MVALFFLISLGACTVGAVCGIGGGIFIKPLLDAFGVLGVSTISFLSGTTVLAMACYSVVRMRLRGGAAIDGRIGLPLGVGAAVGGIAGGELFEMVSAWFGGGDRVGAVQAICLALCTVLILAYTLRVSRVKTLRVKSPAASGGVGLALGIVSSFLGIGGGPLNLMVLNYFFSMDTKEAAQGSLFIILFSQAFRLMATVAGNNVPPFDPVVLALMVAGGLLGAAIGQSLHHRMRREAVHTLYLALLYVIILINVYNAIKFLV